MKIHLFYQIVKKFYFSVSFLLKFLLFGNKFLISLYLFHE